MQFELLYLYIGLIIFAATFIRSISGFGDALIAMPLLAMLLGLKTATPLYALFGFTSTFMLLFYQWKDLDFQASWKLITTAFLGLPFGIMLIKYIDESWLKGFLGILIISFVIFKFLNPKLLHLKNDKWIWFVGFISGILGGAYNIWGVFVIIYLNMRGYRPDQFKATLQAYFMLCAILAVSTHYITGLWTVEIFKYFGIGTPFLIASVFVGLYASKKIGQAKFEPVILTILSCLGIGLLIQSFII